MDNSLDKISLAGLHGKSQSNLRAKKTQSSDEKCFKEDSLLPSTAEVTNLGLGRDQKPSWLQRWSFPVLRRDTQASSEPTTSERGASHARPLLILPSSSRGAAARRNGPYHAARPQESGQDVKTAMIAKSPECSNELGHKNLAELYGRFDNVRVEGWRADLLEIDARKGFAQDRPMSSSHETFEFEDAGKGKCHFCNLYFTAEQNVRDLDNGSSPCSHHPGKKYPYFRHTDCFITNENNKISGVFERDVRDGHWAHYNWTCCLRGMSMKEFDCGPLKIPGCATGYHYATTRPRCCFCNCLLTEEENALQPDGSHACLNHPGKSLAATLFQSY